MMFFKKKQKDDDLRAPSGWGAVLHKTVMAITYPFRKPLWLLLVVLLMAAALFAFPVFYYQVKPAEVHTWYYKKIQNIKKGDFSAVSEKFSALVDKIPAFTPAADKGTDRLVEVEPGYKEVRRQMFKAASGTAPQRVDILAEEADDVVAVAAPRPLKSEEEAQTAQPAPTAPAVEGSVSGSDNRPVIIKKASEEEGSRLRYLDEPVEISGEVTVYNANELEVGGTYLFLYGIYANPQDARGVKGGVFLKDALKGETVTCRILAYTADDVATAECFVEGISINDVLVERGFSDRVSLR